MRASHGGYCGVQRVLWAGNVDVIGWGRGVVPLFSTFFLFLFRSCCRFCSIWRWWR